MNTNISNFLNNIDWISVLRWLSIIINVFIFIKWIRSKIVLNKFLIGRWEGNIINSTNLAKLDCTLIVTECAERVNKAFFYYEQIQAQSVLVRGVDELDDYDNDIWFIFNRRWLPQFFRQFHVAYNKEMEGEQIDARETVKYKWYCSVHSILRKPKLKVKISGNGVNFEGVLHKS